MDYDYNKLRRDELEQELTTLIGEKLKEYYNTSENKELLFITPDTTYFKVDDTWLKIDVTEVKDIQVLSLLSTLNNIVNDYDLYPKEKSAAN